MNTKLWLCAALLGLSCWCNAEVYRWVDSNGKVHYTDKKPAEDAEDITKAVNQQNIDTSSEELRKVETIMRKENDADREYTQQQQHEKNQVRQSRCHRAKVRLQEITGNVIFVDDDGKVAKITEKERQQMVAEVNATISENCD